MSVERIVEVADEALASAGIQETVSAAGEFNPTGIRVRIRGWLDRSDVGGSMGSLADDVLTVGGSVAGTRAHEAAVGLLERIVVGVSQRWSTGFAAAAPTRRRSPCGCRGGGLQAKVHQGVRVRVLALIDVDSGSGIELETMRLPITHLMDVWKQLTWPRRARRWSGGPAQRRRPA